MVLLVVSTPGASICISCPTVVKFHCYRLPD